MAIEFRLLQGGQETAVLPDVESFTLSPVLCDEGAIEFSYPKDGRNWASIAGKDEFFLAVYIDGVRQGQLDAVMKEVDGDDADDSPVWKFTGFFTTGRLAEAQTYPRGWPGAVNPQLTNQVFDGVTPGTLVRTLMQQAQTRGTLTDITMNTFSATHDSAGIAWSRVVTLEYAPQIDYLTLFRSLYEQRIIDFVIVQNDLRIYHFESMAQDLTHDEPPIVFRKGRDLTDSPRKRSTRDLGTVMLAAGTEGLYIERVDAPGIASRRRIEVGASQGQVKDSGTLTAYADASLGRVSSARMEKTHGLTFLDDGSPRPLRDFQVGDWAYSDMGSGLERLRIKQWVLKLNGKGELTGSVTLNDFFAERSDILTRRIDGIVGGSTITGGSRAVQEIPDTVVDGMAPAAPIGVVASSAAYVDNQGHTYAQASASWLQVTTNANGTALEDLDGYRLRWKYQTQIGPDSWRYIQVGNDTETSWSPIIPNVNILIQAQAYDRVGNASEWGPSTPVVLLTSKDSTGPEATAPPLVDNYAGLIRVRYNGQTASGAAVASDQRGVEVHSSTTSNFTPDLTANSTTRRDILTGPGTSFIKGDYGVTVFVKLVPIDHSRNYGAASTQASATPTQIVSADVFDGAIGTAKLANLAVTNAKIGLLAVNDANIGSVNVGKITGGVGVFDLVIGGRLTTALTGSRREMNSIGFQAFDSSNNLLVNLNGVDNLLTGHVRTAITGRRIEMGAGADRGVIDFHAPDGKNAQIRAWTEATGTEAIQFGIPVPGIGGTLWNRINYNSSANGEYATYRSGTHEFLYDSTPPNEEGRFLVFETANRGINTTSYAKLEINAGSTRLWYPDAGDFIINERLANGDQQTRVWMDSLATRFYLGPNEQRGRVEIRGGTVDGFYESAYIKMISGPGYGAVLKYAVTHALTASGVEVLNVLNTGFEAIKASAFNVNSSELGKEEIQDFEGGALSTLRAVKVKRFKRKQEDEGRRASRSTEVGVISEQLPADLMEPGSNPALGPNWKIAPTLAYVIGALQELDHRLDLMEEK